MALSDAALARTAGLAVDLLLWIPKKGDAVGPGDTRPLQLPPCFRRLAGATLAGVVGPVVDPCLSPRQAAIRGGHCGPNVTAAFRHLSGEDTGTGRCCEERWSELFGQVGPLLWDYASTFYDPALADEAAVVFRGSVPLSARRALGSWGSFAGGGCRAG